MTSSPNQPRGTPGLFLLVFSVALLAVAIWGWFRKVKEAGEVAPQVEAAPSQRS